MGKYGEHLGPDPEDVLRRHEYTEIDQEYIPTNYPDWSDKKWKGIYHVHRKKLKEMKRAKEKRDEQIAQIIRERAEGINRILELLRDTVIPKKQEKTHEQHVKEMTRQKTLAIKGSGNTKKASSIVLNNRQMFREVATQSDEGKKLIIYMLYTLRINIKNHKKAATKSHQQMIEMLESILTELGIDNDTVSIINYVNGLPEEERKKLGTKISHV